MGRLLDATAGMWHRLNAQRVHRQLQWRQPRYRHEPTRWLVLQSGSNPSTDYYVRPRADAQGIQMMLRDVDADSLSPGDLSDGTEVIIVRYLSRHWANAIRQHREALAGVVYFMDDDLLDPSAWHSLPSSYRNRLGRHFSSMACEIASLMSRMWVSTAALAERYRSQQPEVMPPLPLVDEIRPPPRIEDGRVRVFYHGTAAHEAEIRWLRPIVAACLEICPQMHFEIIGDHAVNKLYRGLPRTHVLHPMSWPNYLAYARATAADIGLAPLLTDAFNGGRSATKVLDIARRGAIGLYSRVPPYENSVREGHHAALLPHDPGAWISTLAARTDALLQEPPSIRLASAPAPAGLALSSVSIQGLRNPAKGQSD